MEQEVMQNERAIRALEVTAADYADARNAEALLGRLLSHKDAPAQRKVAAGI